MHGWGFPRDRLSGKRPPPPTLPAAASFDTAAATPGGSNLAWRSSLNDRPRSERAALVHETLNFQGRTRLPRKYFCEEVPVAVYETTGHPMPCYYKRKGQYFHIARLDEA
ncbi:hypothetical protein HN011_003130 [Eciton burchellii]|nr:hypothetical protein HN011_003130 [Eciton burchellii]